GRGVENRESEGGDELLPRDAAVDPLVPAGAGFTQISFDSGTAARWDGPRPATSRPPYLSAPRHPPARPAPLPPPRGPARPRPPLGGLRREVGGRGRPACAAGRGAGLDLVGVPGAGTARRRGGVGRGVASALTNPVGPGPEKANSRAHGGHLPAGDATTN